MRGSRDLIAVGLLLALFVAAGLLLGGHGAGASRRVGAEATPDPSITNDRASGSRGAFEWVGSLGYRPAAWRQPWDNLNSREAGVLLVIDPQVEGPFGALTGRRGGEDAASRTQLEARDAATLRRWLASGHTAVLLSSRLASGHSGATPSSDDQDTFGDAMDLIVESASPSSGRAEFAPLQPVRDTQGMLSLHAPADARIKREATDAVALFGDAAGPVALEIPIGRGRLVAVADAGAFSNASLPRSENAVFLANLLDHYAKPGGPVLFDEYHHGDEDWASGSIWGALGQPLQLALIQLGLACVALAVVLGARFGPPIPLRRGAARTSADYVLSVASLYRRAQASGTALETLYRQFLRDVCGRLALPPDVNLERLAEVAARRGQVNKEGLRRLLATCEQRLDEGKVSEGELLDLSRQMERIRKEIGIA